MRSLRLQLRLAMFGISVLAVLCGAGNTQSLPAGQIIDTIECEGSPNQSYALYLPRAYTPETKWPIMYALDPGARGKVPLEHLQQAAESYGFILAGSNNARNGPFGPIYAAVMAVWNDTHRRFSLDPERIYAIGFSGGARAASAFAQITASPVAAVIGCGAGLHPRLQPQEMNAGYYLGLVGNEDFNYLEMTRVGRRLEEKGVSHRIVVFKGGHDWPPVEVCGRALGWLEALAMRDGLRSRDEQLADRILEAELGRAEEWDRNGNVYLAARAYAVLLDVFKGAAALDAVEKRMVGMQQDERYDIQRRQEQDAQKNEQAQVDGYRRMLVRIEEQPPGSEDALSRLLSDAGLGRHREEAGKSADPESAARAVRLLFGLEMDARGKAIHYLEKKDHRRAVVFLKIALKANPGVITRRLVLNYYLACAYAVAGSDEDAIAALKSAVADGFEDAAVLEGESNFDSLRERSEFKEIVRSLRPKKDKRMIPIETVRPEEGI